MTIDLSGLITAEDKFEQAKQAKQSRNNSLFSKLADPFVQHYPDVEVSTWDQQIKEARALDADPQADTPMLSSISQGRGCSVEDLAGWVLQRSSAMTAAARLIGVRQKLRDQIDAAEDQEQLDAIDIEAAYDD